MHHTHDEFLSAIEAQPGDRTLRLVFADWLDEHDDSRGELVRVEEEMRTLPVFSDRFWELKPRRNELRAKAGQEWCARMRYGTECEPVFRHGIPDDWRGRWRLIREFTERWHRVPMGDVGGRQAEIAEAEARLRRKLPPSVREWIAFAHDVPGFLTTGQVGEVPRQAAASLRWTRHSDDEREADWHDGVRFEDFTRSDPPVYTYWETCTGSGFEFVPSETASADAVTAFTLQQVISYTSGASSFMAEVEQLPDLYRHLTRDFSSHVKLGDCEWDEADNLLVEVEPIPGRRGVFDLYVRASATIRREQIPEFLWQYARLAHSSHGIFARS